MIVIEWHQLINDDAAKNFPLRFFVEVPDEAESGEGRCNHITEGITNSLTLTLTALPLRSTF
jgi:hypothetical protein